MKNLKCLFIVLVVGFFFYSCEKDDIEVENSENLNQEIVVRSYNQIDCGFVSNFCGGERNNPPVV